MKFLDKIFKITSAIMPSISSTTDAIFKVISIIKCTNCEYQEVRKFKRGDFIFKKLDKCSKCNGGTLYIHNIYAVPLSPKKEQKEEI
ncbi:MAG: hypothetical protein ACP6IU_10620 [Candidatus Asgardarchaeia archaeon]